LAMNGYAVDWVRCGHEANLFLTEKVYALVILDLGLPRMDGFEVLRLLRARSNKVPVIILTARDRMDDRVRGLNLGADDYLTKPFELIELEARLRALIRRSNQIASSEIKHGRLTFNLVNRCMFVDGEAVNLTARELAIMELLLYRSGKVVSKAALIEHLCNWDQNISDKAIEVYIHRLRRKLEPLNVSILTVRGLGYMLE